MRGDDPFTAPHQPEELVEDTLLGRLDSASRIGICTDWSDRLFSKEGLPTLLPLTGVREAVASIEYNIADLAERSNHGQQEEYSGIGKGGG